MDEIDNILQRCARELIFDFIRSAGPGGQNVNKVETAVRLRHHPSGLVIENQETRSQLNNKENALRILKSQLYEIELRKRMDEQAKIEEQRDTPSMLILDRATPPEKASKPRRLLVTAIVFLVSIIIGTVLTFFVDYLERAKQGALEEDREKIREIRTSLNPRNWFK